MLRATRLLDRPGKTVGEDLASSGRSAPRQRLKHDVVTALRIGRAIPGAVECNERAAAVMLGEALAGVDHEIVRRPVGGKRGDRCQLLRAYAHRPAAVAAVLRGQHELPLSLVEVALGPAVIPALPDMQQFLRGLGRLLLRRVERREILVQLIAPVLCGIDAVSTRGDRNTVGVADTGRVTLRRRELLAGLVGVIDPDPAARLELGAGFDAR